jgi:hypothetical protein
LSAEFGHPKSLAKMSTVDGLDFSLRLLCGLLGLIVTFPRMAQWGILEN